MEHPLSSSKSWGIPSLQISISEQCHFQQRHNWDCGVACIFMVLRACGQLPVWNDLLSSIGTESVWTIDLAMLLHRRKIKFLFFTKFAGVEQSHGDFSYYKDQFHKDRLRVARLFREAKTLELQIQESSITDKRLIDISRSTQTAVILLVNFKNLYPQQLKQQREAPVSSDSFQGHYILICGFDEEKQMFLYRDPGKSGGVLSISPEQLRLARTSQGTDEDLLVVDLADPYLDRNSQGEIDLEMAEDEHLGECPHTEEDLKIKGNSKRHKRSAFQKAEKLIRMQLSSKQAEHNRNPHSNRRPCLRIRENAPGNQMLQPRISRRKSGF